MHRPAQPAVLALLSLMMLGAVPATAASLGTEGAQRLLTRAGFAPAPSEVQAYAPLSQAHAVDRLLDAESMNVAAISTIMKRSRSKRNAPSRW